MSSGAFQLAFAKKMKFIYENLENAKQIDQHKVKEYYDARHKAVQFAVGDKVRVLFDAPTKGFLVPRWEGPYTVLAQLGPVTYRVENQERNFQVHVQRMMKHYERRAN